MPTMVGSKRGPPATDAYSPEKKAKKSSAVQCKSTSPAKRKQPPRACKKRKIAIEAVDTLTTAPKEKLKKNQEDHTSRNSVAPECKDTPAKSEERKSEVVDLRGVLQERELWISPVDQWNVEEVSPVTAPIYQQRWQGYTKDAEGNEHAIVRVCVEFKRIYWKSRKQEASKYADFEEPVSPKSLPEESARRLQ